MGKRGSVQIHRFRDSIALNIGTGKTVYLSSYEAAQIANKLLEGSLDAIRTSFTESEFRTWTLDGVLIEN